MKSSKNNLCQCGCGRKTRLATRNDVRWGYIKGQPVRFLNGHHARITNLKHGMSFSPEYIAYRNAKTRCTNPNDQAWVNYGGRGIRFLFTSFQQFFDEIGPRPTRNHSLDREDVNGHYEPGNVRWATRYVQEANKRDKLDVFSDVVVPI